MISYKADRGRKEIVIGKEEQTPRGNEWLKMEKL